MKLNKLLMMLFLSAISLLLFSACGKAPQDTVEAQQPYVEVVITATPSPQATTESVAQTQSVPQQFATFTPIQINEYGVVSEQLDENGNQLSAKKSYTYGAFGCDTTNVSAPCIFMMYDYGDPGTAINWETQTATGYAWRPGQPPALEEVPLPELVELYGMDLATIWRQVFGSQTVTFTTGQVTEGSTLSTKTVERALEILSAETLNHVGMVCLPNSHDVPLCVTVYQLRTIEYYCTENAGTFRCDLGGN